MRRDTSRVSLIIPPRRSGVSHCSSTKPGVRHCSLLPPLITDLSALLVPALPQLLTTLIALTAPSPLVSANPKILQRVYDVLGALFRDLGRDILGSEETGGMTDVWEVVRRGLGAPAPVVEDVEMKEEEAVEVALVEAGTESDAEEDETDDLVIPIASTSAALPVAVIKSAPVLATPVVLDTFALPRNFRTTPQTRRLLGSAFSYLVRKARTSTKPEDEGELEQLYRLMIEDVVLLEEADLGVRESRGRGAKGRGKGRGNGRGQEDGSSKMLAEGLVWVTIETCQVSCVPLPSFGLLTHTRLASFPGSQQYLAFEISRRHQGIAVCHSRPCQRSRLAPV